MNAYSMHLHEFGPTLLVMTSWHGVARLVPNHGSRDARYATIARRSCSSSLATTWAISGLHSPASGGVLEVIELPEHVARRTTSNARQRSKPFQVSAMAQRALDRFARPTFMTSASPLARLPIGT